MCTGIARRPRGAMGRGIDSPGRAVTASATEGLWREGDHWALRYRGREARVRHAKGLGYLAVLLEHPGAEIHVLELLAAVRGAAGSRAVAGARAELRADDAGGAGAALDAQAKAAYRARVEELREELEQARDWADDERAVRAQEELDFIARELARAVGLGGRDRPTASQAERARQNVGRGVHKAVRQIATALPELGGHLERAVHTGATCSYRPDSRAGVRPSVRGARAAAGDGGDHAHRRREHRAGGVIAAVVATCRGAPHEQRGEEGSTCAVFARASDALACALEVQRAPGWAADRAARRRGGPRRDPLRRDPRARARRPGPGVRGRARTGGRGPPSGGEPAGSRRAPAARRGASRTPLPARAPRPAARVSAAAIRGCAPPQPAAPAHQLRRARAGARRAGGAARTAPAWSP